jgi:LuxR family maltose regulon positive regulatory protein
VLRARLLDEQAERVHELHQWASAWYELNGERSEAIRHAMAGEDFERAADLVELAIPAMRQSRQEATLRRWLEALPDELFQVRPVLSVGFVGKRMVRGELEGVEARLRDAERWLDTRTSGGCRRPNKPRRAAGIGGHARGHEHAVPVNVMILIPPCGIC